MEKKMSPTKDLTELERKIFIKLLLGWDNLAIEEQLKMKRNNIKQIVHSIFKKFDVHSRPELLAKYIPHIVVQREERKLNG
jgi:DNA-binding NarL/FixJ family response regulator